MISRKRKVILEIPLFRTIFDARMMETVISEYLETCDMASLCTVSTWTVAQARVILTRRKTWSAIEIDNLCISRLNNVWSAHLWAIPRAFSALKNLRTLHFERLGDEFGSLVLPQKLESLTFSRGFNQSINGKLPKGLVELKLGSRFDKPIEVGTFPQSLKVLHFGTHFNQALPVGLLPKNLRELHVGDNFKFNMFVHLPDSVAITMGSRYTRIFIVDPRTTDICFVGELDVPRVDSDVSDREEDEDNDEGDSSYEDDESVEESEEEEEEEEDEEEEEEDEEEEEEEDEEEEEEEEKDEEEEEEEDEEEEDEEDEK